MKARKSSFTVAVLCTGIFVVTALPCAASFIVVDTDQQHCYDNTQEITCPSDGEAFYGQDAQHDGTQPEYLDNGDGTVTDLRTGLMWQQSFLRDISWDAAIAGASSFDLAGYTDWRLPTIKELYSLIQFDGVCGTDSSSSIPFLDREVFEFAYGSPRFIDHQEWSSQTYVGTVFDGQEAAFGVNFADGRIKGYPKLMQGNPNLMEARYVRGDGYGVNDFHDNGDGTITDFATGLTWSQDDSGMAMNWEKVLSWVQDQDDANHLGHDDWRLPNAKELQSIVDYTRAPDVTGSPALDPIFTCTAIVNEGGEADYPYFWASTTHLDGPVDIQPAKAVYLCFGHALGWMEEPPYSGNWFLMDVHGAGAQRSDLKTGNPDDWPHGHGPQGDVVRIYNYVRLVRGSSSSAGIDSGEVGETVPPGLALKAVPNPTNGATTIHFNLAGAEPVSLEIFNINGRSVRTVIVASGNRSLSWDGADRNGRPVPAGVYLTRLTTPRLTESTRVMVVR